MGGTHRAKGSGLPTGAWLRGRRAERRRAAPGPCGAAARAPPPAGRAPGGGAAPPAPSAPRPGSINIALSPGERPRGGHGEGDTHAGGSPPLLLNLFKGSCRLCVSCSCCTFSSGGGKKTTTHRTKALVGYQTLHACPLPVSSQYLVLVWFFEE